VHVTVTDSSPLGGSVAQEWAVVVLEPDADGDGWHANVDCDDTDPGVNPGHSEVVGNGKDDDCNPATTDEGSPPTAFFNPLSGGRNVALLEAGASVQSVSSQYDSNHSPEAMLDFSSQEYYESPPGYPWGSGYRQITNQWVKILLAGGNTYLIDRVKVMPRRCCASQRVRDFQIAVSTTTADDAAFTTILTATAADTSTLQEFMLPRPVLARYIRYSPLNNRGDEGSISTHQFKALTGQEGNQTVTFHNLSTDPDGDIAAYFWDFGDGSPTSAEQSPSHTFPPGPGTYTVTLTVTDGVGQSHSLSLVQRVLAPPVASFTFSPPDPAEGQSITFTASNLDPDGGPIIQHRWTFGDGSSPSIGNPITHSFGDNGSFLVTWEVADDDEQTAQVVRTVTPSNLPPTINAGPDPVLLDDTALSFTMTIADPGSRDTLTCLFDFGDGGVSGPGACSFSHIYQDFGTYTFTATVTDDDGASATESVLVRVLRSVHFNTFVSFTDLYAAFSNTATIGFSYAGNKFVGSIYYSNQLYQTDLNGGNIQVFGAPIPGFSGETYVSSSLGLGGFGSREVFAGSQSVGTVYRFSNDGSVSSPFVSGLSGGVRGIAFDPYGQYGNNMIVTMNNGNVYSVDSTGSPMLLANVGGDAEGLDFTPQQFGTIPAGTLVVVSEGTGRLTAIAPNGTKTDLGLQFSAPEMLSFVPLNLGISGNPLEGFYAARYPRDVIKAGASEFASYLGDAIITEEVTHNVYRVSWDAPNQRFMSTLISNFQGQPEDGIFVTAAILNPGCTVTNTCGGGLNLSPAVVVPSLQVGVPHTLTATLFNVSAPEGVSVTFTVTGANPQIGTGVADPSGLASFAYTGVNSGLDTIVATATVGTSNLTSNSATVTWVAPPNTPPLVFNSAVTTNEDVAVAVFLNATDSDGDSLTYAIVNGPTSGTLSGTRPNLLYTPNANFFGPDSLTFTAHDGSATSNPATVTITVTPINDPPIITVPGAQSVPEGELVAFSVAASDVDGDPLVFSASGLPAGATFDPATRAFSWTPDLTQSGSYVVIFSVSDGSLTDSEGVAITVTDVSPPTSIHASGGAYFLHDGYQEKLSLDVTVISGAVQPGSWLKYYYTRTRMNLASTQVLSTEVVGSTATVTGVATVNGVPGYGFIAQVTDGAPDAFGITIHRPDGTLFYTNAQSIVGGDLIIQ
jgi:PKD repeat protein